ncbi:ATP-binding protein [Pelagovum pacificum]|uniref:C4-dicarboxylate transport sensor protein DctB n=1 Tax=Pelagovum pacificum TaxID=2588711 RepID=A0A5C5GB59_9RHOB|nr:ATP-binding protein [Pelagovum pacificum]QQA41199.1 sensor histidine kinase [Pelagovum pacificum]TNY31993.1 sensor histidine kinase [Pelagovum pacificum]
MTTRTARLLAIAGWISLAAAVAAIVFWAGYRAALEPLARRGDSDLALASDRLSGQLQRFRELAVHAAVHPDVRPVVEGGPTELARATLLGMRDRSGSLDILVVDADGEELLSALGSPRGDHAGAPYFRRALDGALGVHHLRSDRWGRRTFLFAAPIFSADGPVEGAVVVAVDAEAIEQAWRGDRPTVFFSDRNGVVFLSNRSELVGQVRSGAPEDTEPFLGFRARQIGNEEVWQLNGGRYLPSRALHITLDLPVIGMTGEALVDTAPARQVALLQAAVAAAVTLIFGALLVLATERRRTLAEANQQLEARVQDRTAALTRLNADLRREVAERTAAEGRLKKAQADLVQAGKLSALGEMSAGISHELNQPLMAIRSFTENAEAFLERGRTDAVAANLGRIGELSHRMGRIIRNLRAFARQESHPPVDVDLVAVVNAVLEMAGPRLRETGTVVDWTPPDAPVIVRGGEVRLQQVVLNLVSNALDAMAGGARSRLEFTLSRLPDRTLLSLRDHGPGIREPERMFDPFYSTKEVGQSEGMGLGLSISYGLVQSFGGAIGGRNHPDGGAVLEIELDNATGRKDAA